MKQAVFRDMILTGYFACEDGYIWSNKRGGLKKLAGATNRKYPNITLTHEGEKICADVHRIVCETYHKFPVPAGVTRQEWSATPESVKKIVRNGYQVNHIDHDPKNSRPDNLEWVSARESQKKYQEHKNK